MRKKVLFVGLSVILILGIVLTGCVEGNSQESLSGATQVQNISEIPKNAQGYTVEQQNIIDRLKITTDPTKVLWIHLISLDGNIIKRMPVRNKVTSSGKRLEPTHAADAAAIYPDAIYDSWETDELIQPDGTFGQSDNYIYWFDPMGRYHQWGTAGGLGYLLTDYPIDLQNPIDEITGLYNVQKAAAEWQAQQEAILKQKEGGI